MSVCGKFVRVRCFAGKRQGSGGEGHPGDMRSDKLNATRCDSVNLTRQAVTSEFHRESGNDRGRRSEIKTNAGIKNTEVGLKIEVGKVRRIKSRQNQGMKVP